jgi:hypothetical protein
MELSSDQMRAPLEGLRLPSDEGRPLGATSQARCGQELKFGGSGRQRAVPMFLACTVLSSFCHFAAFSAISYSQVWASRIAGSSLIARCDRCIKPFKGKLWNTGKSEGRT